MTANYDAEPPKPRRRRPLKASSGKLRLLSVEALDGRTFAARRYKDLVTAVGPTLAKTRCPRLARSW